MIGAEGIFRTARRCGTASIAMRLFIPECQRSVVDESRGWRDRHSMSRSSSLTVLLRGRIRGFDRTRRLAVERGDGLLKQSNKCSAFGEIQRRQDSF